LEEATEIRTGADPGQVRESQAFQFLRGV